MTDSDSNNPLQTAVKDQTDRRDSEGQVEHVEERAVERRSWKQQGLAISLAVLGVLAAIAGILLPETRDVLLAIGGVGLFGAVLTFYLDTEAVITDAVGESVYNTLVQNEVSFCEELGLTDERVYLPDDGGGPTRLFVPTSPDYEIPNERGEIEVSDGPGGGLLLVATGSDLFDHFERSATDELSQTPHLLGYQLIDALVTQFELVRSAELQGCGSNHLTVSVSGSVLSDVSRFDHPVASFVAVAVANVFSRPVELEIVPGNTSEGWLITCRW